MDRTRNLKLKYIVASQAQKEVTINEDLNVLDMLVQATAKGIANTPPESPAEGDMYIIGDAPVGAWEGKAKHLAGFFAGVWLIVAPRDGWRVWLDEGKAMRYQGGMWADEGAGLDAKAPLDSPAFTGMPTAPTAGSGTNTTQIATTAFVAQAVATIVNSAPEMLDTLQELARALNNDPNFATTILNSLAGKVNKAGDVMTGGLRTPQTDYIGECGYTYIKHGGIDSGSAIETNGANLEIGSWQGIGFYDTWGSKFSGSMNLRTGDWRTIGAMKADAGFEGDLRGTADNANKLGDMTLDQLLAEVDRRIAAKHP